MAGFKTIEEVADVLLLREKRHLDLEAGLKDWRSKSSEESALEAVSRIDLIIGQSNSSSDQDTRRATTETLLDAAIELAREINADDGVVQQ